MTPEQQGLIEDIAVRFVQAAPDGWKELKVDVSMLKSISGFAATAVADDGAETTFYIDDTTDKKILHALARLREDMAADSHGQGAWYIMSLDIPRDGKPFVDFDYYTKPEFGVHVGEAAFRQDLADHPREARYVPKWLGGEAEADVAEVPADKPAVVPAGATEAAKKTTPVKQPAPVAANDDDTNYDPDDGEGAVEIDLDHPPDEPLSSGELPKPSGRS